MKQDADVRASSVAAGRKIRTLLVDDSAIITDLLRLYLDEVGNFEIVGIAQNGLEAVAEHEAKKPDLIIMDINMPKRNGLVASEIIKKEENPPKIILLTLHAGPSYRQAAEKIGVDGFCDKLDMEQQLLPLIETAFADARHQP